MVLRRLTVEILSHLDELAILAIAGAVLTATKRWRWHLRNTDAFPVRVATITVGTLCIAYGVREFLRATDGGYYCCNHWFYQAFGAGLTAIGWAILLLGLLPLFGGIEER